MNLQNTIVRNRRKVKYKKLRRRLWLRRFDYDDMGKTNKYFRVLEKCGKLVDVGML